MNCLIVVVYAPYASKEGKIIWQLWLQLQIMRGQIVI
jgi:hypothetical protein